MVHLLLIAQQADTESGLAWYAYPFWLLAIGSLVYWIYRRVNHMGSKSHEEKSPQRTESPPPSARAPEPRPPAALRSETDRVVDGGPTTAPAPSPPASEAPSTSSDRPRSADRGPVPSNDAVGGRTGLFASKPPPEPAAPDRTRRPIADLLKGVTMPCDLVPVISARPSVQESAGLQIAFSTNTAPAHTVGGQVGDELERLGYTLESVNDSQVEARRDDDRLLVTLVTSPADVERDGGRAYPTLPPDSIVVDFESV